MNKEEKIKKFLSTPPMVGDYGHIKRKYYDSNAHHKPDQKEYFQVIKVVPEGITLKRSEYKEEVFLPKEKLPYFEKDISHIGENPINHTMRLEIRGSSLESMLFECGIIDRRHEDYLIEGIPLKELNMNPFVYINGEKKFFQRDNVWPIEYKQAIIHSIYNNIECGRILVRQRSWKTLEKMAKAGETELAFKDIVDGKQRLTTLKEFLNNEFYDKNGIYYKDFSKRAQRAFLDHHLFQYVLMPEDTTDEEVLRQFLLTNINLYPQSPQHIQYVEGLYKESLNLKP